MAMLYESISSNKRKSILLISLFFIIIGFLGYAFGLYFGSVFVGVYFAIFISMIMTFIGYYAGDIIILRMSHAVEADRKKYPHLVNSVEGLAIAAGSLPAVSATVSAWPNAVEVEHSCRG